MMNKLQFSYLPVLYLSDVFAHAGGPATVPLPMFNNHR